LRQAERSHPMTDLWEKRARDCAETPGSDCRSDSNGIPCELFLGSSALAVDGSPAFPRGAASLTVPSESYFVLGDNRLDSQDSRYYGPVSRSSIVATVISVQHGSEDTGCP
jgi:hypothetical protein